MTESASRSADNDLSFLGSVREGDTVAGKYVVGRRLGVGGMGIVYAAHDARLDRQVAIKVLLPKLITSPTATQRFMREARAATRITSEHVVKLLQIDSLADGTPLLVMEYLEGRDLRAVLREDGPLAPQLAVDYLLQALQAIAEGHMQTIVHRDVKPGNLFLTTRADGSPLIKVLDFGIAKTLEPEEADTFALTGSEDVRLGSPTYMPPEQLQNPRDVDMRSDIWSLGVTLHELVCGKPPFHGHTYAELLTRILSAPPDSLESRIPDAALPAGLAEIVAKCLAKKREDRYSNAVELATALAPFGSDDARLSLFRVTGLSRSPASPRPTSSGPVTLVSDALPTCATTMPVQLDPVPSPDDPPASGPRRVTTMPPPARGRLGLISLGAAVLIAGALLAWRQQRPSEAHASTLPAVPTVGRISALRPAPTSPAEPPTQASPNASFGPTNGARPLGAKVVPGAKTARLKPALPPAPATTEPFATHPPTLPDSSAARAIDSASGSGLSEIERLIEKRH